MSTTSRPLSRPARHLRIFGISLAAVVLALAGFLFGVNLEAVTPAVGIVVASDQHDLRAPIGGLIEPGWYEDKVEQAEGSPIAVRLDRQGDGLTDPERGPSRALHIDVQGKRFHKMRPGDILWPGQIIAGIRPDNARSLWAHLEDRLRALEERNQPAGTLEPSRVQRDGLRDQSAYSALTAPEGKDFWLVTAVQVQPKQAVQAGDLVASIVPIDSATKKPRDLAIRLTVEESHCGHIDVGDSVRVYSPMFNHRLHGWADAEIERIDPQADPGDKEPRYFSIWAKVLQAPFALRIGSSCKAEIVSGRKPVYRIILEH